MPPLSQTRADHALIRDLRLLQDELLQSWIERSLPEGWNGLESSAPVPPGKTRVTIRLDSDMLRWFKALGPGYQGRINDVLRIYWNALVSGRIKAHWDEEELAPPFEELILKLTDTRFG